VSGVIEWVPELGVEKGVRDKQHNEGVEVVVGGFEQNKGIEEAVGAFEHNKGIEEAVGAFEHNEGVEEVVGGFEQNEKLRNLLGPVNIMKMSVWRPVDMMKELMKVFKKEGVGPQNNPTSTLLLKVNRELNPLHRMYFYLMKKVGIHRYIG
ncbi:hypothetical protein Pfo_022407, partial [Paulownia fortunei]